MNNLVIRDGTSQTMRALPALAQGYFALNEMSFAELLVMVAEFGALVRFATSAKADNTLEEDWTPFFQADETVVMSRILALDLEDVAARLDDWWQDTPEQVGIERAQGSRRQDRMQLTLPVVALASHIDQWYVALGQARNDSALSLRTLIENVIVELGADKNGVLAWLLQHPDILPLAPVWGQALARHASPSQRPEPAGEGEAAAAPQGTPTPTKSAVRSAFHGFLKGVEMIRKEAQARVPASLISQQHDPAMAMLIAFVQQFQKLQGKLNRFTQHYLDFYYDQMLGARPLPALADKTWLVLTKNPSAPPVLVPADTPFLAGLDADSRDIVYRSRTELLVTDARVAALQTLYFDRDPYSAPEQFLGEDHTPLRAPGPGQRSWPTGAWWREVPVAAGGSAPAASPLLGAPKDSRQRTAHVDARIGFAVASKVLLLKEGQRRITLQLLLEDDLLTQRLDRLCVAMGGDDGTPDADRGRTQADAARLEEIRRADIFLKVFRRLFRVSITGEHGWLAIDDYLPAYDEQNLSLSLSMELPPEAPCVVAYSALLHEGGYRCSTPMLRLEINPGAYLYPYGLLRELCIAAARIEVDVSGYRDLVLHNNLGQLSASAPFAPFGPLPKIGSFLVVGSTEMAGKSITSFEVDVQWADLPRMPGGFATLYRDYGLRIANRDFQVSTAVLAKGAWTPALEGDRPTVPLFRSEVLPGQGEQLDTHIRWRCQPIVHLFEPDAGVSVDRPLSYGPGAKNGFFKFTLAAPGSAFGHERYAHALSEALVNNARSGRWRTQRPIPAPPYTPMIEAISINYRASSTLRIDRLSVGESGSGKRADEEQFLHLYPSGWEALGPGSYPAAALLPRFERAGNLYIGLEAATPGSTLTLLFHLREDSLPLPADAASRAGALGWSYLSRNEWKALPASRLLADGTQHFMTSGVIRLALPQDISEDNTVMPAGRYWLRVCADNDLEKYCSLYQIDAQVVEVERSAEVSPQVPVVLPAGSITRSGQPMPGIQALRQPLPSVGGRAGETRAQLRIRMAERLRHKNRAVSAADYEALILQYFPEVFKVKCFANMAVEGGAGDCIRPGHVLVVPLPYWPQVRQRDQMPMLNGNLMTQIRSFLEALASPWSTIAVENPVYELIQVRCSVRFNGPMGNGHYINQLNDAISDFLTPWQHAQGYRTHFGWRIRQHDIEAFIGELPYVQGVSGFSMLRIASPRALKFALFDTAAAEAAPQEDQNDITPLCPWSIAIPATRHAIAAIDDPQPQPVVRTALSRLAIGSNFIISSDDNDQQNDGAA